jgi:Fe2+ or Zn2+ uptake regulation protein
MERDPARRDTPQRKLIRTILQGCCDHPTAETVFERARAVNPSIGFGTVYRNLAVLSEDGEILHLPIPGGADRYDGTVSDHGHYFCHRCGAFGDVPTEAVGDGIAPAGFHVDGLLLILSGLCDECARNTEKAEAM